jgi:hypothetical protein
MNEWPLSDSVIVVFRMPSPVIGVFGDSITNAVLGLNLHLLGG